MTSDLVTAAREAAATAVDLVKSTFETTTPTTTDDKATAIEEDEQIHVDEADHDRIEQENNHGGADAKKENDVEMIKADEPVEDESRAGDIAEEARTAAQQPSKASIAPAQEATEDFVDPDPKRGTDGKEYLVAGIYWSSTSSRPRARPTSSSSSSSSKRPNSSTATAGDDFGWRTVVPSKATTFPPPVFHGETLLENEDEKPFRLPFDILRDHYYHEHTAATSTSDGRRTRKGKGKAQVAVAADDSASTTREGKGGNKTTEEDIRKREQSKKPDSYRYTSKNIYVGRGPDKAAIPAICMCKPPTRPGEMGCGDDCINRMMQYCCEPKLCPCGPDKCGNPPLSKRGGVPEGKDGLRVIWTGNRGFGLKTMVPIKRGEFVLEYRGEIISRNESYRRVLTDYKDSASYYFMDYDGFEVVDAGQKGNSARFINHSCGPNLEVVRWRLAQYEEYQMGLFALHDIPAGTELTYDYGWQDFSALAPKPTDPVAVVPSAITSSSSAAATPLTPAEAIVLGNGTAIDPARQRCYCGAAECSGFLGGRKKVTRGGAGAIKGEGGPNGANKGKRKGAPPAVAQREEADPGSTLATPAPTELQRPKLAFAQARIRVVDPNKSTLPTEPTAAEAEPSPRPTKKPRSSSVATSRTADEGLQVERDRVMGSMRSGREAAKKAAGKLVGSASGGRSSLGGGRR